METVECIVFIEEHVVTDVVRIRTEGVYLSRNCG